MEEMEIPEAIRESVELPKKPHILTSMPFIIGIVLCIGIGGLVSLWLFSLKQKSENLAGEEATVVSSAPAPKPPATPVKSAKSPPDPANTKTSQETAAPAASTAKNVTLLGHLPYEVAPDSELKTLGAGSNLKLRTAAADKFLQMQADARAAGIELMAISAFRDASIQEQLFFGIKEQRAQDAAKRAEVSAPPGYSEHHTGYAIDIGDAAAPATNLSESFAKTRAFRWLEQNALKYSFEMSFPPNNPQGVSYEPWHWRFVGDLDSLKTFYKNQPQKQ